MLSMAMASPVQHKVDLFDEYCDFAGGLLELHWTGLPSQDLSTMVDHFSVSRLRRWNGVCVGLARDF